MHNVPSNANRDNAINLNKQDKTQICYLLYVIQNTNKSELPENSTVPYLTSYDGRRVISINIPALCDLKLF